MARQQAQDPEHYEECPQAEDPSQPCHCEGINTAEENYRAEPPDMFERESGCYTNRL
ncbi:hypothetical protein ACIP69_18415 [Streptomyces hygroscopicus]|uniref:hypothetical protein n=1 Tax=Streptomyces hygroscopicus TaxID=1912 RepID=UPI0037F741ED